MSQASPTWRETAPMAFPRAYHNLTLLPDGTVLASGGMIDLRRRRPDEGRAARRDLEPDDRDLDGRSPR